jgi:hypothetical protein
MIRAMTILALFCIALAAQTEAAVIAGCTRASLQAKVDNYLEALKKGAPSLMPLAAKSKYIENRKEIPFGQGIWKTPLAADFNRWTRSWM